MGDILIHLASSMLRLLGLWSCGDRVSDLHQIPRPAGPAVQRTRAEPAPLRMDVAQFDVGITHQPVAPLGLEDADSLRPRFDIELGFISLAPPVLTTTALRFSKDSVANFATRS